MSNTRMYYVPKVQTSLLLSSRYLDKEKPTFDLLLYEKIMHTGYLGILPKIGHPPSIAILTLPLPCVLDSSLGYMCNPAVVPGN